MDALIDLTSRAVSLIELIQDSLIRIKKNYKSNNATSDNDMLFEDFIKAHEAIINLEYFRDNATKISWVSIEPPIDDTQTIQYGYQRCLDLIHWINSANNFHIFQEQLAPCKYFPAPRQWRDAIRTVLYTDKNERILLADAVQYLPVQIVLAVDGVAKMNAKQQRLLQIWNVADEIALSKILSPKDIRIHNKLESTRKDIWSSAAENLTDETGLIEKLKERDVPLTFFQIFKCELDEVYQSRMLRKNEINNCDHLFTINSDRASLTNADHSLLKNPDTKGKEDSFQKIFKHILADDPESDIAKSNPEIKPQEDEIASNSPINYIPDTSYKFNKEEDVFKNASGMNLWALAFSGGGIRSATFNLGVLQGLAKKGLLGKFDYLSTVSGGGYIGSWLVSWIARNRSVNKIGDRLDPQKSSDPLADEVRPIRWLRMYSNYLAPTTGIMSADSWTVGMTLVRNMLINQLVILSLFLTLIALGKSLFLTWLKLAQTENLFQNISTTVSFNITSAFFLLIAALLAGLGMQSYHNERFPKIHVPAKIKSILTHLLIFVGCLAAFLLSIWIYSNSTISASAMAPNLDDFSNTFSYFLPTMAFAFAALIIVAILGRYDRCMGGNLKIEIPWGLLLTLASIAVGGILLTLVAQLGTYLAAQNFSKVDNFGARISFILLPPLIIEVLSITIVLRMAFLGINFPDERREWWGRIGGLAHRICLIWIILFGITMMGKELLDYLVNNKKSIKDFFAVGWGATLLLGIRYAFSGNTSGEEANSMSSKAKEMLALLAPYLFVLGLLCYLPHLYKIITAWIAIPQSDNSLKVSFLITLILALLTWLLAKQIGVNQFSMHLFYRNRLVRAFLGATRIRLERQRSANPFTGFDSKDDLHLAKMLNKEDYFGPYPLINTTLNASSDMSLDRQDRKAESFTFSPLFSGFDFSRTRESANAANKLYDYAYRPTATYGYKNGPHLGTVMAISGAAASPNMGYHTSALTSFLLSIFNIRLGWWMGNPRMAKWRMSDPGFGLGYLILDLIGNTSTRRDFVCLSDGGHFDNMGLYELIRRKCRYIILSDAEQDESLLCEGLANAVRRCRIDFGVDINFPDIEDITNINKDYFSNKNHTIGHIIYPENQKGILIYIKASMIKKESIDIQEYKKKNKNFPHQSTSDQFFNEEQFESYRKLGINIIDKILP